MANRPPDKEETRLLIKHLQQQRLRRRRLVALLILMGLVVIIAGGIALALSGRDTTTSTSDAAATTTVSIAASAATESPTAKPASSEASAGTGSPVSTEGASGTGVAPSTATTAPKRPATTQGGGTTLSTVATPSTKQPSSVDASAEGGTVVIDPGHQGSQDLTYEPIGPGSSTTKYKMSSGASGVSTGLAESFVNLQISFKLRDELEARGVRVVMTRTTQEVNISNIERARIANESGAALFIRVHCDAFDNSSARGIHVLYPVNIPGWTDDIYDASRRAAQLTQASLVNATGAPDRGLDERDDMTGFNWSDVPVIMPELGFMTNPEEDQLLVSDSYQQQLAEAMAEAAVRFLRGE